MRGQPSQEGLQRKRKQLSSCDICRERRIRCIRDSNDEVCLPCKEKDLECTSNFIQSAPKPNRSVKRFAAARSNTGSINESFRPSESSTESSPAEPAPRPSINRVENSSTGTEISGSFGKHLVDSFYECLHHQCPVIRWEPFYQELLIAGFNASEMSTCEGEVLCLVVQAFGARVSDHPFILGPDAPTRENLPRSTNLSKYGHKRQPFCKALLDRAMRAFHSRGIISKVSIMSISTMILLFWLWENTAPASKSQPRLFTAIALEQMRIMVEEEDSFPPEDVKEIRGGRLFWAIFVGEATASAHTRRQLQISANDIRLFAPQILHGDQLLNNVPNTDPYLFMNIAAVRLFGDMSMIARTISEKLTDPLARMNLTTNQVTFPTIWAALDAHSKLCDWVQTRMQELFGSVPSASEIWLKTLVCARTGLTDLVDTCLHENLEQAIHRNDAEQVRVLTDLCAESSRRSFAALLGLCNSLEDAQRHSRVIAFGGTLLTSLGKSIERLLSEPSHEEGGQRDYTLVAKVRHIEILLDNLKFTAYAWDVGSQIDTVEERLQALKQLISSDIGSTVEMDSFPSLEDGPAGLYDPFIVPALFPVNYDPSALLDLHFQELGHLI